MKKNCLNTIKLLVGFGCIWLFIFVLAPLLQNIETVGILHTYIEKRGMDATPLFYTESEEFAEADAYMSNAFR